VTGVVAASVALGIGTASAAPERIHEEGVVLACSGSADGTTAAIDFYENSRIGFVGALYGSTPDGEFFNDPEQPIPDAIEDGTVSATVPLVRETDSGTEPAGTAVVDGTYTVSGPPTRVHEAIRDNGYIIVIRGTNTPLATDITVDVNGTVVPLTCESAFMFDLNTMRQRIGHQ